MLATVSAPADAAPARPALWALCLGAAGVVYGDIGTSPLYTWAEIRNTGALTTPADIVGAASLLIWTLTLAITLKYVVLVLRADNQGEGGTFALMALLRGVEVRGHAALMAALTFAACLLYADGLLTPAISVLGAAEGIAVLDAGLEPLVLPFALVVLVALFSVQSFGTARLGAAFGAVIVVWFTALGILGLTQIAAEPAILSALWPPHALTFLLRLELPQVASVMGAAVLVITGGEALYADIGHFGVRAVRLTWGVLVFPCLLLAYLGQGAFLLGGGQVLGGNVFYSSLPAPLVLPMIGLATLAAIIASQALISGAFSLTRAAMNLGLLPRLQVLHTSEAVEGQIYLPAVNTVLAVGVCLLVLAARSTSAIAGAYGLAVMGVMTVTTVATAVVARKRWAWSAVAVSAVFVPLLAMDLAYLLANSGKLLGGAAGVLFFAGGLYLAMSSWKAGRRDLAAAYGGLPRLSVAELVKRREVLVTIPRAMVLLVSQPVRTPDDPVPVLLLKFVDRYGALPEHLTLFTVVHEPAVPRWTGPRHEVLRCGGNVTAVQLHVGWREVPDVRASLSALEARGDILVGARRWTIVAGRDEVILGSGNPFWQLRNLVFRVLVRASAQAWRWYGLGSDTAISTELVPVLAEGSGMRVVLDVRPDLEQAGDEPRS